MKTWTRRTSERGKSAEKIKLIELPATNPGSSAPEQVQVQAEVGGTPAGYWSGAERLQSALRVQDTISALLASSAYYPLRHVSCRLQGNILRLEGRVSSYYEKQIAQSLVLQQLSAEMVLANELEVGSA